MRRGRARASPYEAVAERGGRRRRRGEGRDGKTSGSGGSGSGYNGDGPPSDDDCDDRGGGEDKVIQRTRRRIVGEGGGFVVVFVVEHDDDVNDDDDDENNDGNERRSSRVVKEARGGSGGYTGRDPSLVAECVVRIREQDTVGDDARPWVIFVPLRKRDRTKFMIEKCTKIVAGRMMPISSDRMMAVGESSSMIMSSVGPPTIRDRVRDRDRDNDDDAVVDAVAVRLDKLEAQSIEASEQCERLDVPMITRCAALLSLNDGGPSSRDGLWTVRDFLSKWCSEWEERGIDADGGMVLTREIPTTTTPTTTTRKRVLLICRERGSGSDGVVPVLRALRENDRVAFLVGPEGGWSAEEEGHFDDVCSEYDDGGENGDSPVRCVSLGASILRAETACMVAVSAWALSKDSR